jgi:hypothetical protein
MDRSITLITPELMQQLGADAFDRGLGADDHDMNHSAQARKDWQFGWHQRRIERSLARADQVQEAA